jgi:hypothetical protein
MALLEKILKYRNDNAAAEIALAKVSDESKALLLKAGADRAVIAETAIKEIGAEGVTEILLDGTAVIKIKLAEAPEAVVTLTISPTTENTIILPMMIDPDGTTVASGAIALLSETLAAEIENILVPHFSRFVVEKVVLAEKVVAAKVKAEVAPKAEVVAAV